MIKSWSKLGSLILDGLYPPKCALCGFSFNGPLCDGCKTGLVSRPFSWTPIDHQGSHTLMMSAVWPYEGTAGQLVRRLKYDRVTSLAPLFSRALGQHLQQAELSADWWYIPVPLHWSRKFQRGFNQSELIMREFPSSRIKADWLKRIRNTPQQAQLPPHQRQSNLVDAFLASPLCSGKKICLIDDVSTTGQTLIHCTLALQAAGCSNVLALCLAGN